MILCNEFHRIDADRAIKHRPSAEVAAKAALLNFLRDSGGLTRGTAATTELILDKHSVRADVVLCNERGLHCFEIKTQRDTLSRLDNQVATYARHGDLVTVVAATKHINAVISRVPDYVGIYELLSFSGIRVVREATVSPVLDTDAMLSILPVSEIASRLRVNGRVRSEAVDKARLVPSEEKRTAVLEFFRQRYLPTTKAFLRASRRRAILPKDLVHLKRWIRGHVAANRAEPLQPISLVGCQDEQMYRQVGKSFSPVPDDVRRLLLG
jgi:hypothetical protein